MAIVKNPKRNKDANLNIAETDRVAEAFISGLTQAEPLVKIEVEQNKKPIMVRVDPDILKRVDRAARRLGISRSAFIVSSVAEKLERME